MMRRCIYCGKWVAYYAGGWVHLHIKDMDACPKSAMPVIEVKSKC